MVERPRKKRKGEIKQDTVDTTKPTALFHVESPRLYTITVALPGSVIGNAQTHDLKNSLAGQIARALSVFCVDEIVIFDDGHVHPRKGDKRYSNQYEDNGYTAFSDPNQFLYHILSYLETPPYLRRSLFPVHPNLGSAGNLPSLDMPHHLRADEWCRYREAVTIPELKSYPATRDDKSSTMARAQENSRNVHAGFSDPVTISTALPPNTRVTLDFRSEKEPEDWGDFVADVVHPATPREEEGWYWGYQVRPAASLAAVFTECPFDSGYDYCVGTSERGTALGTFLSRSESVPQWKHLLIVFGGVAGLEVALKNDKELNSQGVQQASELFDAWINLVPGQGSRTIRTEEAIWLGLMGLRGLVVANSTVA